MPALFCLRLAVGMLSALLLLNPSRINPRFYRTHFLTALALTALVLLLRPTPDAGPALGCLIAAVVLAALGSMAWSFEGAPGGRVLIVLTLAALAVSMLPIEGTWRQALLEPPPRQGIAWVVADDAASAALLGVTLTAMLMGHSYLIAPAMSLIPLYRLLASLFAALAVRATLSGLAFAQWTAGGARLSLNNEAVLWLPLRWALGLLLPAILTGMAWHTTRLRNTQSSTGILYVAVVLVFLGELTALLLFNVTGYCL